MSIIREISLSVFQKVDKLAEKYIQHNTIRWAVEKWIRPRLEHLIRNVIPENELKQALNECFYEVLPIIDKLEKGRQWQEAKQLNPPEIMKKLEELPDYKDYPKYEELINNVL